MNATKIAFSAFLLSATALALPLEYPYLYKDPRVMAMGGAYTAVGGSSVSLFYNPAGLSEIPLEEGFEVNLFGVSFSYSDDGQKFLNDFQDALNSSDQVTAVNNVLKKYRGRNLFVSMDTFPSIAKKSGRLGWSVGGLAVFRFSGVPHQGFGPEGLLSVDTSLTYGGLGGASYDLSPALSLGFGFKYMTRSQVRKDFTARELVENQDNFDRYLNDQVKKEGSGTGLDLGVLYRAGNFLGFRTTFGASVLNIGDLQMGQTEKIPRTLNVGVALKRKGFLIFRDLTLALDIADITKNYSQDNDLGKRIRLGGELGIFKSRLFDLIARAGSYQGHLTLGAEIRLLILRVVATTYSEELGAYSGQDPSRRYILSAYITW